MSHCLAMAQPATRSLGRLSEIAQVMVRHGFGYFLEAHKLTDLLPGRSAETRLAGLYDEGSSARGQHLRELLDELGPTFVKFGQLLSTRPDIVPPDIIVELRGLQDDVRPFPFEQAERVIEEDLGNSIDRLFLDVRPGARRRGVDRSGASSDPPERQARRRQDAASGRAAADRGRPRAALPGGEAREGARARARLHRRARSSSTSSRGRSGRSSTTASRAATRRPSTATSPAIRTCACRRSTGRTPARAC